MNKLTMFLYSNIINKKIYDEFNEVLGVLKDVYVTTEDGYPRIRIQSKERWSHI